ncbi:flagellar hook capping FlgD N-terminal domain-containing protein [Oceanicella sp. SM1341]|uniref:flagellar hook capping FlgD N-terminal domain-containing protein n=1 Tax=Oceanicella sp. SM1341 TaxID=1548889 RepID=UPI000E53FF3D|nr:flagellar hook capping FlgD N-terminal domain-containing protein [Oceanicella sp. SM1341]
MEINSTTAASATAASKAATPADSTGTRGLTADFETFLTLLTTQLRNQDPLEPVESTEFVAQLASFSAVEQQVQANESLKAIAELLSNGSAAGLSEWIGTEVRAYAAAPYDGTPLTLYADPVEGADLAVLVVSDTSGAEVGRVTVNPAAEQIVWDGEGTTGTLPEGSYSFTVESYREGTLVDHRAVEVFSPVVEVRREEDSTVLVLADGSRIDSEDITTLRAAGG